jgi:hypothetical protein
MLRITILPRTLSTESPSNDYNNTERHQRTTSSLENGNESEKKLFTFPAPNGVPNNLLKNCTTV